MASASQNPPPPPGNNDPSDQNNQQKKGKGRQKIPIAKIENETNLQVTFSKRRAGLFKKASELSTLCGAESAIVVFSPGDKVHSYGNPSVDAIADRFLNQYGGVPNDNDQAFVAHDDPVMRQRCQEITELETKLALAKKRKQERRKKKEQGQIWCPPEYDALSFQELEDALKSLVTAKHKWETALQEAASFGNPYVQNQNQNQNQNNPAAADGILSGGLPVPAPTGPTVGFPMDPNIQGLNDEQFAIYGNNNEGMLTNNAPIFGLGGTMDPTMFDFGGSSSNTNVAFPTMNPGGINDPNQTYYPDMVTTNPNPGFGYFDPFDLTVGNFDPSSLEYQLGGSSSNAVLPQNFGNPNYDMGAYGGHDGAGTSNQAGRGLHGDHMGAYGGHGGASTSNQAGRGYGGHVGASTSNQAGRGRGPGGTHGGYDPQDESQGFNNNYGGGN